MKKLLTYLFLALGIYNLYQFVISFVSDLEGPFYFFFFETGIMGYRIKSLLFAAVFLFAFYAGYKRGEI